MGNGPPFLCLAEFFSGEPAHIQSVDVKFDSNLSSAALDAANSLHIGNGWSTAPNVSLNNSNCTGSGSGFICSQDSGAGLAITQNSDYKWVWDVMTAAGSNLTSTIHIGANYNPANRLSGSFNTGARHDGPASLRSHRADCGA